MLTPVRWRKVFLAVLLCVLACGALGYALAFSSIDDVEALLTQQARAWELRPHGHPPTVPIDSIPDSKVFAPFIVEVISRPPQGIFGTSFRTRFVTLPWGLRQLETEALRHY